MKPKSTLHPILAALGASILAISSAAAQTELFWSGNGATQGGVGIWDTTNENWGTDAAGPYSSVWDNSETDTARFASTAGTVTLDADVTVGGLIFNTNNYIIAPGDYGYKLTFSTPGDINVSTGTTTINAELAGSTITKTGGGILILGGVNTYTGGTVIDAGELRISADTALGNAGETITFNGNATLGITSTLVSNNRPIILNNNAFVNFRQITNGGAFATSGAVTGTGGVQISSAVVSTRRTFAFTSLDNTFTGPVRIGDSSRGLTLTMHSLADSNSVLEFGRNMTNSENIELIYRTDSEEPVALTLDNRQIVLNGGGARATLNNLSGLPMTINTDLGWTSTTGNRALELRGGGSFNGDLGNHPDSGSLAMMFVNSWTLTGDNSWSGMTDVISGATLEIQGTAAMPDSASLIQLSKNSTLRILTNQEGMVNLGNNIQLNRTDNSTVVIQNYIIHVGNHGGATTDSTIVLGNVDFTKNDNRPPRQITTTGTNGYSVEIGDVMLWHNLQGTTTGGAQRFTPSTASLKITGTLKHINGDNGVRTNSHSLYLGGAMTGNVISGMLADADDFTNESNENARPLSIYKDGSGDWTFSGDNTYTGTTTIHAGTLVITGATQSTSAITFGSGGQGVLGLDTTVSVSAANAVVDFTDGEILVTGTPSAASYTLLTASSITGTPVLADPVPGYELQVVGNELLLVDTDGPQPPTSGYDEWAGGAPFDDDASGDGIANGLAFLLGSDAPGDNTLDLLPTSTEDDGGLILNFSMLNAAERGDATLSVEYGNDLVAWSTVLIPDDAGVTVNGDVTFDTTPGTPLNSVTVTISSAAADGGGKLFARLSGQNPTGPE